MPPLTLMKFSLIAQREAVRVPALKMPPPMPAAEPAMLPETEQSFRVNRPSLRMPPPEVDAGSSGVGSGPKFVPAPSVMVSPEIVAAFPVARVKTEKSPLKLPWTASFPDPGPVRVRASVMPGSPLVRLMLPARPDLKLIVSAPAWLFAALRAARRVVALNVPGPPGVTLPA